MEPVRAEPLERSFFRKINERIRSLVELGDLAELRQFVCECGDRECAASVGLTVVEYDAIREEPDHYVVGADHRPEENERCIVANNRFAVVAPIDRSQTVRSS